MDKFSDIWNSIKERFSSPLLFSFMFSWIFFNWPITVSLLWFDPNQLKGEGHPTIFSFIRANLNTANSFWYPLAFAVLYTLFSPILKNMIKIFYAKVDNESDKRVQKLMHNALKEFQDNISRVEIIRGKWSIRGKTDKFNVQIANNQFYYLDEHDNRDSNNSVIGHFFYDSRYRRMNFIVYKGDNTAKDKKGNLPPFEPCIFDLEYQGNDLLVGRMNGRESVRWEKISE